MRQYLLVKFYFKKYSAIYNIFKWNLGNMGARHQTPVTSINQTITLLQTIQLSDVMPHRFNPILEYLKNVGQVLRKISNGEVCEILAGQLGELAEVVSFYKSVQADVNTYFSEYIQKQKGNTKVKFWQKARQIIKITATNQKANLDNLTNELQTLMKSNQQMAKQLEALPIILQFVTRGDLKQSSSNQKYANANKIMKNMEHKKEESLVDSIPQINTWKQILSEVENMGTLTCLQFRKKFDRKYQQAGIGPLTNKEFAELLIRKVLSTHKSLRLQNNTACEARQIYRNELPINKELQLISNNQRAFPFPSMISPADTEFITSQLLKLNPHSTIKRVSLLFKYPLMHKMIMYAFSYIGERPNFIVVVKLKSGRVIAMYSQISLERNRLEQDHGKSFIASVTSRKAFYFREDCYLEHSVAFTVSRLIFGNGELLLYMGQPSYMQVDINQDMYSFETVRPTAEMFVGGEAKQKHEVDEYEIFQVEFEKKKK